MATIVRARSDWLPSGRYFLLLYGSVSPFSSPEAAILLVSDGDRDLWPGPMTFRF